jgi:lysyl-tRNA synthetase class 2
MYLLCFKWLSIINAFLQEQILSIPFIEENDQTQARQEHLEALRQLVGNAYPNKFERSQTLEPGKEDTITAIVQKFRAFEPKAAEGQRPPTEEIELANQQLNKVSVRLAGRIASPPRVMGKVAFVHLSDGITRLQVYVRRADVIGVSNDVGVGEVDGWALFGLLDHGDFIGVEGYLFITKTGELSIHVQKLQFLAKALLPLPDKMHGIQDPEIRQRQRYVDLIAGSLKLEHEEGELTPREVFERRSAIIREMRRILDDHGYVEVETPMLTSKATGAAARPFKTHHNALDIDLYARIAPELYLKRLLVGGFEKVYELNRNFRNEGIDRTHNPEFTMLEFYWAYADVNQMMDFCEELVVRTVEKVLGSKEISYNFPVATHVSMSRVGGAPTLTRFTKRGTINLAGGWPRHTMKEAIGKYWRDVWEVLGDEEFDVTWLDDLQKIRVIKEFIDLWIFSEVDLECLAEYGIHLLQAGNEIPEDGIHFDDSDQGVKNLLKDRTADIWRQANNEVNQQGHGEYTPSQAARDLAYIFEKVAEPYLFQPTFIYDFPKPISPLAKASPADSTIAERFELFIAGVETANGFSELNDPAEQYQRFLDQMTQRERGDEEAMVMDEDYIRALSYGMPPAAGIGIGIDRFVMLLTNRPSIRDVILFPHMRPERKVGEQEDNKDSAG